VGRNYYYFIGLKMPGSLNCFSKIVLGVELAIACPIIRGLSPVLCTAALSILTNQEAGWTVSIGLSIFISL